MQHTSFVRVSTLKFLKYHSVDSPATKGTCISSLVSKERCLAVTLLNAGSNKYTIAMETIRYQAGQTDYL